MAPVSTRGHSNSASDTANKPLTLKAEHRSKRKTKDLEVSLPEPVAKVSRQEGDVKDTYEFSDQIGSGGFADVFRATHKGDHEVVAIKKIQKHKLSTNEEERVYNEIRILQKLYHPNIMRLKAFYEEAGTFYLVLENVGGGELFDRICQKSHYDEHSARNAMRTILYAVKHCHEHNIVHRDLKPENLMLLFPDDDASLKIIDFGLAIESYGQDLSGLLGTPQFMAPEILNHQRYGKEVDMWAIGVILFCLLGGYYPFQEQSQTALFIQIKKGNFFFNPLCGWTNISSSAKDLICRLLNPHPGKRFTVEQALQHEWMMTKEADLRKKSLSQALSGIQKIQAQKRWKKSIHAVVAINRMKSLTLTPGAFKKSVSMTTPEMTATSSEKASSAIPFSAVTTPPPTKFEVAGLPYAIYEQEVLHVDSSYKVVKGMKNDTKEIVAVKIVRQSEVTSRQYEAFQQEIENLRLLRSHPNVISFYNSYELGDEAEMSGKLKEKRLFVITEFIAGKEVFDRISYHGTGYSEKQARRLAFSLLSAIDYMHQNGIVHRDLRPNHLYLTNDSYSAELKIIHFTSAISIESLQSNPSLAYADTTFHQYPYSSPELLQRYVYDQSTDMWSFGMILSFLLLGQSPLTNPQLPPVATDDPQQLLNVKSCESWKKITKEARDLIQRCVCYRPRERLSANEALIHKWFQLSEEKLSKVSLEVTRASVRKYQIRRKFRVYVKALLVIIRIQKLYRQYEESKESKDQERESKLNSTSNKEVGEEVEEEGSPFWNNCSVC